MKHDWRTMKFAEVFDLQMGKTPSRDNPSYWNGEHPWVSISDLKGKYINATKEKITTKALESGINKVRKGTVIMSFKLTVGRAAIADCDLYTNEAIMSFVPKPGFDILTDYIYYYLRGYKWMGANKAVMGQTLNKKSISENVFAFPPLPVQEQICSLLDKMNRVIEAKKEQLKELDTLAQSIFYDSFGDPVANERKWDLYNFEKICDVRDGTHDSPKYIDGGDYILITSKNIVDGKIDFSNISYITKEDYDAINKRSKVDEGDIIMAMIGTIGKPIIVKKEGYKFCIKNVALIKFFENSMVSNVYIQALLSCSSFAQYILSKNQGGTQKFIALGTIRKLPIPVPPLPLQQAFAEKVEAIERQKELINQSIRETQLLFDSRMEYWFGEE